MRAETIALLAMALGVGAVVALAVGHASKAEENRAYTPIGVRYGPYYAAAVLPAWFCLAGVWLLRRLGPRDGALAFASGAFGLFLEIGVYCAILLILLPWIRRRVAARTCAALWLLPNVLYVGSQFTLFNSFLRPRWVICVPEGILLGLFYLWAAGFVAVLLWKILSHLYFRRKILRGAAPVSEEAVLAVYRLEAEGLNIPTKHLRLLRSPGVAAPVSVGLFRRTTCILLPARDYTPAELALIFRHELIHISREDPAAKFFLTFCAALCWLDPLIWPAMARSAQDMELGCDETVLLNCDAATRRQYAELLLSQAGDGRGFTTCLAASAGAMRYRLRAVTHPAAKGSGAVLAGALVCTLVLGSTSTALAWGESAAGERIFSGADPEAWALVSVTAGDTEYTPADRADTAAAAAYLTGQTVWALPGRHVFPEGERTMVFAFQGPGDRRVYAELRGRYLRLTRFGERYADETYYLPQGTHWDYLDALLPQAPQVGIRLYEAQGAYGHSLTPTLTGFAIDGVIYVDRDPAAGECAGLYGAEPARAEIAFPLPLASEPVLETDGGEPLPLKEAEGVWTAPLPARSGRYVLRAEMLDTAGRLLETVYTFSIGFGDEPWPPEP